MNEEKSNTNKGCLPLMIIAVVLVVAFMAFCMRLDNKSTSNTQRATEVTSSVVETTEATETTTADSIPKEYKSALISAQRYSDNMSMSKAALYDQLTSQYDQFTPEEADYAVANLSK